MELAKIPGPMRVVWGSIGAWWVGQLLNPGFFSIAILMLTLMPVLIFELYCYEPKKVSYNHSTKLGNNHKTEETSPLEQSGSDATE